MFFRYFIITIKNGTFEKKISSEILELDYLYDHSAGELSALCRWCNQQSIFRKNYYIRNFG
ncbi:MAG: hypothetical protein B7Y19_08955, partial [Sphingobacteriales bacterium 24-40-4]